MHTFASRPFLSPLPEKISRLFLENAEPLHTTSQPATPPSSTARSPVRPPRHLRTRRTCNGEDTLARNAHNAHLSRFSIFVFTPSHTLHKQLIHRSLSVKTFISDTFTRLHLLFAPSSAHAATPHRAPRAIAPTRDGGEGFAPKTFTSIYMDHNILRHTSEEVKAKNENRLMRAREEPSKIDRGKICRS